VSAFPTNLAIDHWYVVQCRVGRETQTTHVLEQLGLTVYLPEVRRLLYGRLRAAPFFPGYLFVNGATAWSQFARIRVAPGVVRLVAFGDHPQPVAPEIVELITRQIGALNAQGGLVNHPFRAGDQVRITRGPLRGLEAVFVGPMRPSQRVCVLLEFLGSLRQAELPTDLLEPVAPAPTEHPPRRTRGKGRFIKEPASC
jgi:transcriptional antiterminator RfaH